MRSYSDSKTAFFIPDKAIRKELKMQSNCSRKERITVREELIGGKRYIVVSHYAGNKEFKKIIYDHAFRQTFAETDHPTD